MPHRTPHATRRSTPIVLGVLLAVLAAGAAQAEHRVEVSRQFDAAAGTVVELENLAGAIEIEGGGSRIEIEAVIVADDEALANQLTIGFEQRGGRLVVSADYPIERHDTYHYPGSGDATEGLAKWLGWFGGKHHSRVEYQGRKVSITSQPGGDAVTLYVDFTLRLPAGVGAKIDNAVGPLAAANVDGPLSVDTAAGAVRIAGGAGKVVVDTGSGDVEVIDRRGAVNVDTGSGDVRVTRVTGDVLADTGSGNVTLEEVAGERIDVDTGSGSVELHGVSGEIRADTGSGGVRLAGDFGAVEGITISTGSGGVTIAASAMPPADIDVTTGSGGIDVDLPGVEIRRQDRHELRASTGGGMPIRIETGSGRVTIRQE